ncbi:MAG: 50S ribosomal protein L4 [Proteobacteria bacterium]|nr:50S ribosomal protein L4 [Pseudomonadota bacterium]
MQLAVLNSNGSAAASGVEVSDQLFGCSFNEGLVHQVVTAYMAAGRAGTKAQKTKSMVRGGGIKPWKQKGTGRARAGSIRSPLWRGGGKVFAAVPRSYEQKINRKMYRAALRAIFSELVRQNRLKVVEQFTVDSHKTKDLVQKLSKLDINKVFIIVDHEDQNLLMAAGNLPYVQISDLNYLDPVSLVAFENVLVTVDTLKKIEERLS